MGSKSEAELAFPLFKIRPGAIIPCDEPEKLIIPHFHVFDTHDGGVVFGSSIWWVTNPDNSVTQTTKIKGLICRCGSILMLEE